MPQKSTTPTDPGATRTPSPRDLATPAAVADAIAPHVGGTRTTPETSARLNAGVTVHTAGTTREDLENTLGHSPLHLIPTPIEVGAVDDCPEELRVVDHVEDVLVIVGAQRRGEVTPGVKVSICELPVARQRAVFAQLYRWAGAQVQMPADSGSTRSRVHMRFTSRPQLVVAFAATAVAVLRRTQPTNPLEWVLDEDVTR
jgi:hypothetical protein